MRIAITGGARGIGSALVSQLKSEGHWVTSFDIAEPKDVDHWIPTDLSDPASIDTAVAEATGSFDALINNAGIPPRNDNADPVLRINWFGLRQVLDAMLPKLNAGAAIVNTASRAGGHWRENRAQVQALIDLDIEDLPRFLRDQNIDPVRAYNLSKEAVIVMTIARTEEMLGRGLRMNSVSPGAISTDILQDFKDAFGERVQRNLDRAGRAGTAEEVAQVIAFLASPRSAWIKGQDIAIDGGMGAMALADTFGDGHGAS